MADRITAQLLTVLLLNRIRRRRNVRGHTTKKPRRWGIRPVLRNRKKHGEFYTSFLVYKFHDHEWFFNYTRMTTEQFDALLSIVGPLLCKTREPLSAEQRLALTLKFLAHGDSSFSLASGYKVGKSTVCTVVRKTLKIIWDKLNEDYLPVASEESYYHIADQFQKKWNLPHVIGAIDEKHIKVKKPPNSGSLFFNYKEHFSVVLSAVCDAHYNFTYVDISAYGSQSDGGILSASTLGAALKNNTLALPPSENLPSSNIDMPYFFVGDDAFALNEHVMKPYKGHNLNVQKAVYNYRISRARRVIENSFGVLAARWQIFSRTIQAHPDTVDNIIKATVCLHNFIKKKEFALQPSRQKYCPPNYVDRDSDLGIIPGDWRLDIGNNVILEPLRHEGRAGHNPTNRAVVMREKLCVYLSSPAGAKHGQTQYVSRGSRLR